jgi:hypothetical protein
MIEPPHRPAIVMRDVGDVRDVMVNEGRTA